MINKLFHLFVEKPDITVDALNSSPTSLFYLFKIYKMLCTKYCSLNKPPTGNFRVLYHIKLIIDHSVPSQKKSLPKTESDFNLSE